MNNVLYYEIMTLLPSLILYIERALVKNNTHCSKIIYEMKALLYHFIGEINQNDVKVVDPLRKGKEKFWDWN